MPGTQNCRVICAKFGGCNAAIVDTPGFDDPYRTDAEILLEIAQCLAAQRRYGVKLKGIIYLHRITDCRFQRAHVKSMKILELICGPEALSNVALVTNRWEEIDTFLGQQRKEQLCHGAWAPLIENGAVVRKFDGTSASIRHIFAQLLGKPEMVLQIHREVLERNLTLGETKAGAYIETEQPPAARGGKQILQRRLSDDFLPVPETRQPSGEVILKGFLGVLGMIVGLSNLILQITSVL
jgi:hypothetical protein